MRYLNIRKNEYVSVIFSFIYSFLIVSFFILSKSFRDALFLNTFGKEELSFIYLINPIITGFFVWIFIFFLKNRSLLFKSVVIHIFTLIVSLFLLLNLNDSLVFAYYIFVDFQVAIIALLFWQVLSGCFTNRQAKRLFGIITSGGFLSALILGSSLSYITLYFSQKEFLLLFNLLILFCPIIVYQLEKKSFQITNVEKLKSSPKTWNYLINNKYILNIIFITFLFTIISIFIDYNFKLISYNKFSNNSDDLVTYFTKFYSIASFISFLIQILLSGHIINKYGIKYSLIILPAMLLFILPFGYYLIPFVIISLLKGQEQIFKPTLHDTSMQILWMPIPSYKKIIVKPLVNIVLKNIFSSVSALLLIISVYLRMDFTYYLPLIAILLITLIYLLSKTRGYYINELIRAIDDRSLSLNDEDSINLNGDAEFLKIISKKLELEKKNRYFILNLLDIEIIKKSKKILQNIFHDSDLKTQKLLLEYFKDDDSFIDSYFLIKQINECNAMSVICLSILVKRESETIINFNTELTKSKNMDLKYSAINNCIYYNYSNKSLLLMTINKNISNNIDYKYIIAHLNPKYTKFTSEKIIETFPLLDMNIFLDALKFIDSNNINNNVINVIIDKLFINNFVDDRLITLFKKIDINTLFNYFEDKILDLNYLVDKKIFINEVIISLDISRTIKLYEKLFLQKQFDVYYYNKIISSLIDIKRKDNDYQIENTIIQNLIKKITDSLSFSIRISFLINENIKNKRLQSEYFSQRIISEKKLIFKTIYYSNDNLFKNKFQFSLLESKVYLNKIIEIYEEFITDAQKTKIIPILDDLTLKEKNNQVLKHYKLFKDINIKYLLSHNMTGNDEWYDFIILPDLIRTDISLLLYNSLQNNIYFKLVFNHLDLNEDNFFKKQNIKVILDIMITILEKTLYLKDSSIFTDVPANELIYVAQSLVEINLSKGSSIFKDGDIGDSMYFIFNGEVQISKGGTKLVTLKKADYFGEMALLDGESRSADAMAIADTILLKLDASNFKKILYSNDKIIKGILSMLSARLRKANELLNKNK